MSSGIKYIGRRVEKQSIEISGSTLTVIAPTTSSTAIFTNNIQNGYPTSNNWKTNLEGSFFNNFDNTTHVSEILRFMAGVLSHSLDVADAKPNTKTWSSVSTNNSVGSTTSKNSLFNGVLGSSYQSARLSQHWTSSAYINFSQTSSYRQVQDYLQNKGFFLASEKGTFGNDTGTNPFTDGYATRISNTITQQGQFGTFSSTVTGNAGGSTDTSNNSNYFGLGTLTNGGVTPISVIVIASMSFSDNYSNQTPDESSNTYHTASNITYTQSSFGTSNGLIIEKLVTSQPAVIPSAFQDGDFNNVTGPLSGRKYTGGATAANSISASGYYKIHDIKVGLKTGSMATFEFKNGTDSGVSFYLYTGDIPSDITSGAPNAAITNANLVETSFSATSRSLSGAPYLLTTTYAFAYSAEGANHFNPCYGSSTTPLATSISTNGWNSIGSSNLSNTSVIVNSNGVSTNSSNGGTRTADKSTQRTSGTIPHITDVTFISSSYSFTLSSNQENVGQNRSSNNTLNYNLALRTTARNWKNSSQTDTTSTQQFYNATKFGQISASGSMAIYSRAQGYDTSTVSSENFTGEDRRIQLNNKVTTFTGDLFVTDTFQTNDEGDGVLGDYDLQVKPGYLVDPGGNYGYWFASGFGSGTYKYYVRKFSTNGGTKTSMTLTCGKTLQSWASTSNGISAAIIFESSTSSGNNTSISTCRLYDPTQTVSNLIEAGIGNDNHKNPFSSNIDLYGNSGGSISGNTYTLPIRNADGMFLDSSDNELYVIIRYKGDPSPVTSITVSFS